MGSKATINPAKLMNGPHRGTKSLIQKFNLCIHSREQTLTAQTPFFFFYTRVNSKTELTCVCVVCVYHQVFPPVLATTCTSKEYKKKTLYNLFINKKTQIFKANDKISAFSLIVYSIYTIYIYI